MQPAGHYRKINNNELLPVFPYIALSATTDQLHSSISENIRDG